MRIGIGYDVHRLEFGRKLVLGGVDIPYEKGLLGHSDADVLCHAIIDSLLGAAKQGDIGEIFPDTDAQYKDISSIELLERTGLILHECHYQIINIDCVVCAQEPKLVSYKEKMQKNIAFALTIQPDCVCVKATTEEGLGITGSGEGITARAVCLIQKYDINNQKKFL